MKRSLLAAIGAVLLLDACALAVVFPDDKERELLSAKMVKLSSAVDTYFDNYPEAPIDTDLAILKNATRYNPSLLAPEFKPYQLRVQNQNPYAVVLMCSEDGSRAIMEDAGCSTRLDRLVMDEAPCKFTLYVGKNCTVEGADSL